MHKYVNNMTYQTPFKLSLVAAAVVALAACSSSSKTVAPLASQAVDGYIVGASVSCDDTPNGFTQLAGKFTCPGGSILSQISGGDDVGFDDQATTGVAFTGVLKAPASAPFVTPMTTVTVAIAQSSQEDGTPLDLGNYEAAQASLAQTLGIDIETFSLNPADNIDAAKSNAKIHQVLAAFAPNVGAYEQATSAFAQVITENAETGGRISLTQDVSSTMMAINGKLAQSNSGLALATADLNQVTSNVVAANTSIENAESPSRVANESQKALIDQAPVTIDRNDAMVTIYNDALKTAEQLSIEGFESALKTDGQYTARLYSGMTSIEYDNNLFQFNQNINNTRVSVAFEIKSDNAGDNRSLIFSSDDIVVSANKGRSESLIVSMLSEQSTFQAVGVDAGTKTEAIVQTNGETFSSDGDTLTINMERINTQLSDLGFEDILKTSGDYSVTLVIKGLRINEQAGNTTSEAREFTVGSGADALTGNGFRGYVSVIRD